MLRFCTWSVVLSLVVSASAIAAAIWMPINVDRTNIETGTKQVAIIPTGRRQMSPVLAEMAGRQLIRPAQIRAAVKDTGAAQRLLKELNLQGVIQMGGELAAYIRVKGGGVQSVKKGDKILEFDVVEVTQGKVKLSLQGVEVQLGH